MSLTLVGLLLGALSGYSYYFIRRSGLIQQTLLLPFLHRVHSSNVVEIITDEEHDDIHQQIDIFYLRIVTCFIAAVIATGVAALFLLLVSSEGDGTWAGYIMSICFAYVVANYDLNSKIIQFVYLSDNELTARILQKNVDNSEHETISDYLKAKNEKMLSEWLDEVRAVGEEFENRLQELGYDEDRDYMESHESEMELIAILEQVTIELEEKHPELREK